MESIKDILVKRSQAIEIFQRLGITSAKAQEYGNVKLMKIIYFFYIKYMGLCLNGGGIAADDSMACYRFSAWPYGPVETTVYSLIGMIREQLDEQPVNAGQPNWNQNFPNSNQVYLLQSLNYVNKTCMHMTAAELVRTTHETLQKWSNTPMYKEMSFTNADYLNEYNHLPAVH